MEYKDNGDFIECWDYCYESSEERLFGAIRIHPEDEKCVFHPARKVTLNCMQLKSLYEKLRGLNNGKAK